MERDTKIPGNLTFQGERENMEGEFGRMGAPPEHWQLRNGDMLTEAKGDTARGTRCLRAMSPLLQNAYPFKRGDLI